MDPVVSGPPASTRVALCPHCDQVAGSAYRRNTSWGRTRASRMLSIIQPIWVLHWGIDEVIVGWWPALGLHRLPISEPIHSAGGTLMTELLSSDEEEWER